MLRHQLLGGGERLLELVRALHPHRLAAQALGHRDMVDAVALDLVAVDVVEGEADLEVHLEAALRLADQAEIGVVHDHMQVGQLVLGADRQLLDHELEVVVAGQRHDLPVGIGRAHAQRRRQGPARAGRPGRN